LAENTHEHELIIINTMWIFPMESCGFTSYVLTICYVHNEPKVKPDIKTKYVRKENGN